MQKTQFAEAVRSYAVNGWEPCGEMSLAYGVTAKRYRKGGLQVLVSHEPHDEKGGPVMRWHLSISRQNRYPHWDEIKDARYSLLPHELTFAQILPPPSEYTNVHPNCFHLWEIDP